MPDMDQAEGKVASMSGQRTYPLPPPHVEKYVEALGEELAIDFLLNFGGAELALPVTPKGKSEVERLLGPANVLKLAKVCRTLKHRVPLATKWVAQCLAIQGLSTAAIARRLRISDTTARKHLRGRNEKRASKPGSCPNGNEA